MRGRQLSLEEITKLSGVDLKGNDRETRVKVAQVVAWVASNMVLPEVDCPHCGQDADECDEDPCDKRRAELENCLHEDNPESPGDFS